jgi:hypothetical protein
LQVAQDLIVLGLEHAVVPGAASMRKSQDESKMLHALAWNFSVLKEALLSLQEHLPPADWSFEVRSGYAFAPHSL